MRRSVYFVALGLLFSAVLALGQMLPPTVKKGDELVPAVRPVIYRATAAEMNGEVVVRLSYPTARLNGKKDAHNVSQWVHVWEERRPPFTFGKEVKAYSQAGKPMSKEAVLKALAKPAAVVCFVRASPDEPERPDPFYTAVFRDDTVLLVFRPGLLYTEPR